MFKVSDSDGWLHGSLVRWKPFLISLAITPIAILLGIAAYSPEGIRDIFGGFLFLLGLFLFPVPVFLLICAHIGNAAELFYPSLFVMLIQFPFYGFVMSLTPNRRRFALILGTVHVGLAVFSLGIFLAFFGWRALLGY